MKKYKINYSSYVLIYNLVLRELQIVNSRINSLSLELSKFNHKKNISLRLESAKLYRSKLEYLRDYLVNLH